MNKSATEPVTVFFVDGNHNRTGLIHECADTFKPAGGSPGLLVNALFSVVAAPLAPWHPATDKPLPQLRATVNGYDACGPYRRGPTRATSKTANHFRTTSMLVSK